MLRGLDEHHNVGFTDAYGDISIFMEEHGFSRQQGFTYLGNENINAVDCVLVSQKLSKSFPWLSDCIKYINMYRRVL